MAAYKYFLLPAYVLFETLRAILTYAALHSKYPVSPTNVTFSAEVAKAIFAAAFLCRYIYRTEGRLSLALFTNSIRLESPWWKSHIVYAVPALLYFTNTLLYLFGLQITTPSLLHAAIFAKLPITAVFHHFLIKRQRSILAWASLAAVSVGLIIFHLPEGFFGWLRSDEDDLPRHGLHFGDFMGPLIGLFIAIVSGFTSTFTEIVLKQNVSFWVAQLWLYLYGILFSGIVYASWDGRVHHRRGRGGERPKFDFDALLVTTVVTAVTAATGLAVANILRKRDNLVKLVGALVSIIAIVGTQFTLFPKLRASLITFHTVFGLGVIGLSTWVYDFYKQDQPLRHEAIQPEEAAQFEIDDGEDDEQDEEGQRKPTHRRNLSNGFASASVPIPSGGAGFLVPTLKRLSIAAASVLFLALLTLFYDPPPAGNTRPGNTSPSPSPAPLPPATSHLMTTTGPLHTPTFRVNDVERFFVPHSIEPASWTDTPSSLHCIEKWVSKNNITQTSSILVDWEAAYRSSGCPIYPIPTGGLVFHMYWRGKWLPFLSLTIESFLATQRLGDGHKLYVWWRDGGPPIEVIQAFQKYDLFVEFRELEPSEGSGYCVETMREWADAAYQRQAGIHFPTLSDITRALLLAKYGGVWLDADMILLRDLTPLIRCGPSAPALDAINFNNDMLIFGPPSHSPDAVGSKVLETACSIPWDRKEFAQKFPSITPKYWSWLYNDGLFQICATLTNCGVARMPIAFTDGRGFTFPHPPPDDPAVNDPCVNGTYPPANQTAFRPTLRGLWSLHGNLGRKPNQCVELTAPTLMGALRRRFKQLLEMGLEMNGRDVFPGVAYDVG